MGHLWHPSCILYNLCLARCAPLSGAATLVGAQTKPPFHQRRVWVTSIRLLRRVGESHCDA